MSSQLRLIKISLYLSLRYDRYVRNNWVKSKNVNQKDPYASTAIFFGHWFCHAGARAILNSSFSEEILINTPLIFFEADYTTKSVSSDKQLKEYLREKAAPKVVHLAKKIEGKIAPIHTVIYLGTHPKLGDFVFEKESAFEHFKLTHATTLVDYYPNFYWGFREITDSA
jgi:hypothetical protein